MYDNELRQRRSAPKEVEVSLMEKILDKAETVANKGFDLCQLISFLIVVCILLAVAGEGVYHLGLLTGIIHPELFEITPEYDSVSMYNAPFEGAQVALVLYNASLAHHTKFINDARKANSAHKVQLASLDCGSYAKACEASSLAYNRKHLADKIPEEFEINGDEPEMIFVEHGTVTDSYHGSQKDGTLLTSVHSGRVETILKWLDLASSRGESRKKEIEKKRDEEFKNMDYGGGGGYPGGYPGRYGGMGRYPGMDGRGLDYEGFDYEKMMKGMKGDADTPNDDDATPPDSDATD